MAGPEWPNGQRGVFPKGSDVVAGPRHRNSRRPGSPFRGKSVDRSRATGHRGPRARDLILATLAAQPPTPSAPVACPWPASPGPTSDPAHERTPHVIDLPAPARLPRRPRGRRPHEGLRRRVRPRLHPGPARRGQAPAGRPRDLGRRRRDPHHAEPRGVRRLVGLLRRPRQRLLRDGPGGAPALARPPRTRRRRGRRVRHRPVRRLPGGARPPGPRLRHLARHAREGVGEGAGCGLRGGRHDRDADGRLVRRPGGQHAGDDARGGPRPGLRRGGPDPPARWAPGRLGRPRLLHRLGPDAAGRAEPGRRDRLRPVVEPPHQQLPARRAPRGLPGACLRGAAGGCGSAGVRRAGGAGAQGAPDPRTSRPASGTCTPGCPRPPPPSRGAASR